MGSDLFGSLGGLGNILGGIAQAAVPKDTPEGKLLSATTQLGNLRKQESDILVEIGRQAYEQNPSAWPQDAQLKLIQQNIAAAEATLNAAKQEQEASEQAKAAEDAKGRCPNCGHKNQDGVKFCQECGTPLAAEPAKCSACGTDNPPGTRFCGGCGAQLGN